MITHPATGANVARYTLATTPIGGYQLSSGSAGWFQYAPPYLMQTPITAVCSPVTSTSTRFTVLPHIFAFLKLCQHLLALPKVNIQNFWSMYFLQAECHSS